MIDGAIIYPAVEYFEVSDETEEANAVQNVGLLETVSSMPSDELKRWVAQADSNLLESVCREIKEQSASAP